MKRFSSAALIFAVILILSMAVAVAEGLFPWTRGLEDNLQVTDEIKEAYKETELFDKPRLSVTQNGVTVTLDQCIVDTNAAYIAFRVQGYAPELGRQPEFGGITVEMDDTGRHAGGWDAKFFDGLVASPDGFAVYSDGRVPEDYGKLPYANENGELLYIISMRDDGDDFSYVGKTIHVTLKDLGVYSADKLMNMEVAVEGTWEFEWTLKGTDKHLELTGLNLPIGENGSVLTAVHLSPIHVKLEMNVPRHPEADEDEFDLYAPYFRGVVLKDGTVYDLISGGGADGYLAQTGEAYRSMCALSRIIEPDQVAALIFTDLPSENRVEVKIQ